MTWEIFSALLSAAGTLISVIAMVVKMTKALSLNTSAIEDLKRVQTELSKTIEQFYQNNRANHREFYRRFENHEGRIIKIEGERISGGQRQ